MFEEIVYVIKTLDSSTHKKLIAMVVGTLVVSILIVVNVENPVVEKWKEDRATEQAIEQRREERKEHQKEMEEEQQEDEDLEIEEDNTEEIKGENTNKEPVY